MKRVFAVLLLLLTAAFLLYRKSARLWWTYDSPWLLHITIGRHWYEAFTLPDTRQNLFVPLLTVTNELLLQSFGLEPSRWYLAQIVVIALAAFAIFAALRLYVSMRGAVFGALLFLLGPPVASGAAALYVFHYFEAILLIAVATALFVRQRSVLSAIAYLAAMLAKEIAVPLPLALWFLPERKRAQLIPHGVALALYAAWRLLFTGTPTAYGWHLTLADAPRVLATLPWRMIRAAAGASLPVGLTMIALAALCIVRTRRSLALLAIALVCAVAPILPVSVEVQDRFTLLPWAVLCAAFAFGAARMKYLPFAVIALALVANRQEWTDEFTRSKRMSDEAYVWAHERGDVLLRNPAIPTGTMPELEWFKEEHLGHERGARWFYDDIYLCLHSLEGRRILEYDPRLRRVEEVHPRCPAGRTDVPMSVEFEQHGQALEWRFGPYTDGSWRVIAFDGEHAWDMPREGSYLLGSIVIPNVRVRYQSPRGWITYSPEIALDFARQRKITWRR